MRRIVLLTFFVCITCFSFAQRLTPVIVEATGKVGFMDDRGHYVLEPVFDNYYSQFWDGVENKPVGFATVKYKGKWGCINRKGEFVVKPVFAQAYEAHKGGEGWQSKNQGSEYVGLHMTAVKDVNTNKWGFLDDTGTLVVSMVFDDYYSRFWDGVENKPVDFATVKFNGKWGCINRQGEFVVHPSFENATDAHRGGEMWVEDRNDQGEVYVKSESDGTTTKSMFVKKNSTTYHTSVTNEDGSTSDNMMVVYNAPVVSQKADLVSPKLKIISPASGSGYNTTTITIRYEVNTANNIPYDIIVSIDGERFDGATMKGVKRVSNEIEVAVPRKVGKACNVQLVAKDTNGNSSEPVSVALNYTGNKPKPNLIVLAVGISEYEKQGLRLKNAANDARDFVALVKSMNSSHYENVKISSVLVDREATFQNIRKAMSQVVRDAAQDDVVMLFFSGHGSIEENSTYFLPVDADTNDLFATSVNFDDIVASAKRLKDKACKVVLVMDACHSGALLGLKSAFALEMAAPGISILSSSTGNQQSKEYPEWRNGVFTKYLLDGLKGDASDAEGNITIDNLGFYVRKKVSEKDPSQSPLYNNEQRNFILFEKSK